MTSRASAVIASLLALGGCFVDTGSTNATSNAVTSATTSSSESASTASAGSDASVSEGMTSTSGVTSGVTSGTTSGATSMTSSSDTAVTGCETACDDLPSCAPDCPECDIWGQDCPRGEKCMPWASDGDNAWDAVKCTLLDPDPVPVGGVCTAPQGGSAGVDDCEAGAMCWGVDPDTQEGICVDFCEGSPEEPACSDPETQCSISNNGALILCLPGCDPLAPVCASDEVCVYSDGGFICVIDASGSDGQAGDPCAYVNACDPGHACVVADYFDACMAEACCASFCDLEGGDACPVMGQECIPWFKQGTAPPGHEDVGFCGVPP